MFIAQTHLGEYLAKLAAILCKDGCRLLVDLCVSSLHGNRIGGLEIVGIGTVVVGVLATE